jgi:diguanylate cyclase (GGDEF)-like protein
VVLLSARWPLLQYAPTAVAVIMAGYWHYRDGHVSPGLTWLLIATSAIILVRQFLGARTNEGLVRDLNRQRAILARQASRDPLTELGNRKMFMDHATDALADADDTMTAVILIDLDGFKGVNDTYGHATGDALLRTAAERLNANVRANDTVSRLGGDEFVVLLPRLTDDQIADTVAHRILRDLLQPLVVGDTVLTIRASAGIALTRGSGAGVEDMMREADLALYQAKAEGKGVARRFDPARFAAAEQRRREEAELRRALDAREFEVHYQPIVDLDGGHTVGVEALVRWRHPERGLLPPAAFLDLAESMGLLPELGGWVLAEACRQARKWIDLSPKAPFVSVNLAVRQVRRPGLIQEVTDLLEEYHLPPGRLQLEITESAMMNGADESVGNLRTLSDLGVRIAIDDFGTGYSNLSYLRTLPVCELKVAGSFVEGLRAPAAEPASLTDERILATLVSLAHTLNLTVTAEGVETAAQADRLRAIGCDAAQGWHFGAPMSPDHVDALL